MTIMVAGNDALSSGGGFPTAIHSFTTGIASRNACSPVIAVPNSNPNCS